VFMNAVYTIQSISEFFTANIALFPISKPKFILVNLLSHLDIPGWELNDSIFRAELLQDILIKIKETSMLVLRKEEVINKITSMPVVDGEINN